MSNKDHHHHKRSPMGAGGTKKGSPELGNESEKSYEYKRLGTDDLLTTLALEHHGIDQKKE